VISSVFVYGGYKRSLGKTARERSAGPHVTGQWLVTVTFGIASEVHCRKSTAQASGFLGRPSCHFASELEGQYAAGGFGAAYHSV